MTGPQPVTFPPGDEAGVAVLLRQLAHPLWRETGRDGEPAWTPEGRAYRRWLTSADPLRFVLTYLGPYVTDQVTGQISFAKLHLAMCAAIAQMAEPGPVRHAFVGPRRAGKSIYRGVVAPAFLLGHGHRRFYQAFGATDYTARGHLGAFLDLLHGRHECSALLLRDFPELRPVRGAGGPGRTVLAGDDRSGPRVVAARGLGAETKGEVYGNARPDVLAGDDLTKGSQLTPGEIAKVKAQLREDVLPMNDEAAVLICGTVFKRGDPMDDVVRSALGQRPVSEDRGQWLAAERITCHYHRAPGDWPQRWSGPYLAEQRAADPRTYALRFEPHLLDEVSAARHFPPPGGWVYGGVGLVGQRVLVIDEAYSKRKGADRTAMAVMSADTSRQRVCVEHVEHAQLSLPEKQTRIHELCRWAAECLDGPAVSVVLIEAVRDGDQAAEALGPFPTGTRPVVYPARAAKADRIELLHKRYVARGVRHRTRLADYEAQAQAWSPTATADDMLDAVSAGERFLRTGDPTM